MQELIDSISSLGLMHPIVVREFEGKMTLVAGERRLRAMKDIWALGGRFACGKDLVPEGFVPTLSMGELTPIEAEEAELDENFKRRDLTWQEHAAAMGRLHALRQAQSQVKIDNAVALGSDAYLAGITERHTVADTAKEVYGKSEGWHQAQARTEILVSKHLDNPLIAKAKSAEDALKILKADEQRKANVELAREVGKTFNADAHELYNLDCRQVMYRTEGIFDVICTDPPYGMGADQFGDGAGKLSGIEHHYDDSLEAWRKLMTEWCSLSYAVCKEQAHAYVFCDIDRFHELKSLMQAAGWYVFRTPLVVHKQNSGRVPLPDRGPRRQYELILYAIKGDKPVTHIYPDVISVPADENLTHGAQKPVALMTNLLQRSVKPGDLVFDPFAGTGPTFEAGHALKCKVVGCEISPEYYALSMKRLAGLKALEQPELFT